MKLTATLSVLGGTAASCVVLVGLVVGGTAQSPSSGSRGTWSMKAQLLTPRFDVGVAGVSGARQTSRLPTAPIAEGIS